MELSDGFRIVYTAKGYKPLCMINKELLVYKKNKFYLIEISELKPRELTKAGMKLSRRILSCFRLLVRIFRIEPRYALAVSGKEVLLSLNGAIFNLNIENGLLEIEHYFRKEMSNLLTVTQIKGIQGFDDIICYGEYFNNVQKEEVNVWAKDLNDKFWSKKYTFKKGLINHIHAIIPDKYRNIVWILTGDFDNAAGFWIARDNFKVVEPALTGLQSYRSCAAYPLEEGILYATDTQFESNSIRLLYEEQGIFKTKVIYELEGSCIYSCKFNEDFIFSTTVEPDTDGSGLINLISYRKGSGIKSWNSEIVAGNLKKGFRRIACFKKDIYPMGLCQFGTVVFPSNQNCGDRIIFYGNSLKGIDGKLIIAEHDKNKGN